MLLSEDEYIFTLPVSVLYPEIVMISAFLDVSLVAFTPKPHMLEDEILRLLRRAEFEA